MRLQSNRNRKKYNLIIGLAFIHLFIFEEAKKILEKMYDDLENNRILHLTTTKENVYSYGKYKKEDYGEHLVRYRTKHTKESFIDLIKSTPFKIEGLEIEQGAYGKQWISLRARK